MHNEGLKFLETNTHESEVKDMRATSASGCHNLEQERGRHGSGELSYLPVLLVSGSHVDFDRQALLCIT